ncbi:FMN-binding negative transcriptional regulator [Pseudomonas sp. NPDC007930]|uniref:FMN-binding negative transcriptional regulator n=1 Tax=Pseudomonas sp. NPDC007930 TaxID=3364417 RepID=UPI0036EA54DB
MYLPTAFAVNDLDRLHGLIREFPFATLMHQGPEGLDADHLPFVLEAGEGPLGTLHAHVARANPLWQALAEGAEVLVVFRGGDAYITPNSYPSKHETHRQVPTWNYRVVHARGPLRVHDDARYVRGLVAKLTRQHEASQPKPWKMSDAPRDYLEQMAAAIVGISIPIRDLQGKFKLGQNKAAADIAGAAQALLDRGEAVIGAAMLGRA